MDRKIAEKQAMQIASDIEGPLGRVPMERVIENHINFFNGLRSVGATWPQIAELLNRVGITKKDGGAITASQIRATVSRVLSSKNNQDTKTRTTSTQENGSLPDVKKTDRMSSQGNVRAVGQERKKLSSLRERMDKAAKARNL